ncbi:peptidase M23-like protein [Microterricola gilva]|uniref:Peptidase M23-like protein n=1 Tax=Microterricola gilva TaxID=393267 RepID=A0A4Q8ALG8_9MICO|nr:M23 family metallopeptidase [Microterricola gilva]RZU65288.1 peptidase M23-like protein [Microterricola gilva]
MDESENGLISRRAMVAGSGAIAAMVALGFGELIGEVPSASAATTYQFPFPISAYDATDKYNTYGPNDFRLTQQLGRHRGVDFNGPLASYGKNIAAVADGWIEYKDSGLGNRVVIRHADGYYSGYSHMAEQSPIGTGDPVMLGQTIGRVGTSGGVAAHLHLSIGANLGGALGNGGYFIDHFDPIAHINARLTGGVTPNNPIGFGEEMGLVVQIASGAGAGGVYWIARKTIVHLGNMTDVDRAVRLSGRPLAVQTRAELDTFCAVLGIPGNQIVSGVKYYG